MKILKNVIDRLGLPRVGGIYVAMQEPFTHGYLFTITLIEKRLCWKWGGEKECRCPFATAEERERKCLGVMTYEYCDEHDLNFKCLAYVIKKFRPATKTEILDRARYV